MRIVVTLVFASTLAAQIPATDLRNTYTPNTDTHFAMPEYKTLADWEARRGELRRQILLAAGLLPLPEKTPLDPQIFGRLGRDGYTIEKVLLETMPGYYLAGNLYRPRGRTGKLPAVLKPHGHWNYGRLENQPLFSGQAIAVNFALQGYVVFAYDMVGWNDTIQTPHAFGSPREQLWSFGPLGLQLWNSIRAVDFLESLPDVDAKRIGVTGASGGGTQTFLLTAVDDRLAFSAPVNMISAIMQGGSPCENAPGLRVGAFNVEIASIMAPRPMMVVSATGDWTRNVPKEEFPAIRRIYELYGKTGNTDVIQIDAPHNYNQASREAVYRFFGKHVLGAQEDSSFAEKEVREEKLQDLMVLHNRTLPAGALSFGQIFEQWQAMSRRQAEGVRDRDTIRERLRLTIGVQWPKEVLDSVQGEQVVLSRAGKGDRVPGIWMDGRAPAALVVHPDGADAARNSREVRELKASGRAILLIDAFQTGSAVAPRDRSHRFFLTFNRSDDANRVQDILTALAFLKSKKPGEIELVGLDKAAIWSVFAAALAPEKVKLTAATDSFSGTDQEFLDRFFVPGIQRAGGWKAALDLVAAR
ncbi:MAG TPA: hypothetical protein VLE22_23240 [Bryobacteraceae bacterium]|nr:hypothetical protein [Bryobacteraceae bacterium]